jgi:citrate synthase
MTVPSTEYTSLEMSEFSPGLEGVLAARTEISMVDGQNGRLVFRGYVIADLAEEMSYEEVAYLLWNGELPTRSQLDEISQKLRSKRSLNPPAQAALKSLSPDTHPMDVLRTVVSAQGASAHLVKPDIEQAIANVAVFPTILAAFHRQRQGKEWLPPRDDLDHAANYLYMLTGEEPAADQVRALNAYLVLLADHGMNASTFTARVIASTDSDLVSSLVGAIGALKGPAHGGAPSLVMEQLEKIGSPENAEKWGREALEHKVRFMGFGHRVYRTYDPRAKILKAMCERLNPTFYALASKWEEVALRLLQERHPERPQATNVEFYSAGVLQSVGLPTDFFPATFGISRAAGWTAHVLEQVSDNRLIRPQSEYVGPEPKKPVALDQR